MSSVGGNPHGRERLLKNTDRQCYPDPNCASDASSQLVIWPDDRSVDNTDLINPVVEPW
jgi:hypothetical protein